MPCGHQEHGWRLCNHQLPPTGERLVDLASKIDMASSPSRRCHDTPYIVLPIHPPCWVVPVVPVTRALMMHAHMQYATVNAVANGCNAGRNAGPIRGANHSRPRTSSSAAMCYFGIFGSAGSYVPACDWLYCPCQISHRPAPHALRIA